MTERPDDLPAADEPVGLRLFAESEEREGALREGRNASAGDGDLQGLDEQEAEADFDELPDDLLVLAKRLASEAQDLSRTYPARTPDRLPIGETTIVATAEAPASTSEPAIDRAGEEVVTDSSPRRRFGLGVAAAAGFVAIVGPALYFGADASSRRTTGQIDSPGTYVAPSETEGSLDSVPVVPIRTVSLSLADDGDYRRLEDLLRDRSEPEREALFDLLQEEGGGKSGEATAVRISF